MWTRRAFLRSAGLAGTATLATLKPDGIIRAAAATATLGDRAPAEVAADEAYWREIQQAFTLDRTIINLNNGHVSPSPRVVHEALKRYLDLSNQAPAYHMIRLLEPNLETVRRRLAAEAGCDPEELAITRNASEALQIVQLGLDLAPGDEVLTTNQDYPRMVDTWEQRVRRDGITLTKIPFRVPPASLSEFTRGFDEAITPRTRAILFCHMTHRTGQIFPAKEICALAARRGIISIVDGAHAFAHFPFAIRELGCDYYGTSLHKWLLAPIGTGFLYVRRDRVRDLWPLTPAPAAKDDDIRKFEEIGTHPAANHNAIAEALTFHQAIGTDRKAARLRYLKDRWATPLVAHPRIRIFTSLASEQACGLGTVGLEGVEPGPLADYLWDRHRIFVPAIVHDDYRGIRVTPNIYTTVEEIDTFAAAMEEVAEKGLPGKTQ